MPLYPVFDDGNAGTFTTSTHNNNAWCSQMDWRWKAAYAKTYVWNNMKVCRQPLAAIIGNNFEVDPECAFDPSVETEVVDEYFTGYWLNHILNNWFSMTTNDYTDTGNFFGTCP
mmetsp:Transcript_21334/g.26295  ORF Transcript_21334/g.26295 Transcript_21334/m.26295 type:complete len:114 (-) Transcript_21334:33-374(-)